MCYDLEYTSYVYNTEYRVGVALIPTRLALLYYYAWIQEDKLKRLEDIQLLQTTSYFEDLMMGRRVPYPRQFPVDNEDYEQYVNTIP